MYVNFHIENLGLGHTHLLVNHSYEFVNDLLNDIERTEFLVKF